ncbi:MAG: glucose 1-dehydrogenase [Chloroflexia bacterium]|nr:glucose 1-dehydrogenase [Chloroflexia bacterium]
MAGRLQGKTALVTGADSGIGQAIAIKFGDEGATVVVHYGNDQEGAQNTVEQIKSGGSDAQAMQADLADPSNALALYDQAKQALGTINILVNCAGTGEAAESPLELPLEDFQRVLNIDLVSPWVLAQAAARDMSHSGGGAIVNITSVHEEIPGSGVAYCAAKGGLRNVTRSLAPVVAAQGVRVNNIAPGMIQTPMTQESLEDPESARQAVQRIPMRRPGQPEEIANVALLLASDEASYVTGSTYFVDGGLMQSVGS